MTRRGGEEPKKDAWQQVFVTIDEKKCCIKVALCACSFDLSSVIFYQMSSVLRKKCRASSFVNFSCFTLSSPGLLLYLRS